MKFLDAKIGLWALEGDYWLVFRPFSYVFLPRIATFFTRCCLLAAAVG